MRALGERACAEAAAGTRAANDGDGAAGLDRAAGLHAVGADDARPRLREGGLGVADALGDRDEVAAVITLEDGLRDLHELLEAAVEGVAEREALAVVVDIGLHDEAVADGELALAVGADLHDRQRDLMAEDDRIVLEVAAGDARVLRAEAQHLDIGEAQAAGVHAGEQFIGRDLGHRPLHGLAVLAEVLEAGAIERPGYVGLRYGCGSINKAVVVAHQGPPGESQWG